MAKIIKPVEQNKLNGPQPMTLEISALEKELPYLTAQGVPFEVTERNTGSDFLTIRITIVDSYSLSAYGIAMSTYGFDMCKSVFQNKYANLQTKAA